MKRENYNLKNRIVILLFLLIFSSSFTNSQSDSNMPGRIINIQGEIDSYGIPIVLYDSDDKLRLLRQIIDKEKERKRNNTLKIARLLTGSGLIIMVLFRQPGEEWFYYSGMGNTILGIWGFYFALKEPNVTKQEQALLDYYHNKYK